VAVAINPWILYRALGRQAPFSPETVQNIFALECILLVTGFFFVFQRLVLTVWIKSRAKTAWRWISAPFHSSHFWLSLIPLFLASLLRQSPLWEQTPYLWKQILLGSIMVESALCSALLKTGLIALLVKFTRRPWLAWTAAIALASIDFLDWAFLYYGNMRLTMSNLVNTGQGALAYSNSLSAVTLIVFMASAIFAVITLRGLQQHKEFVFGKHRMAWFAIILIASPLLAIIRIITAPLPAVDRAIYAGYIRELEPMSLPPLLNLGITLLNSYRAQTTASYSSDEVRRLSLYRSNGIAPSPIPGGPFRRIILVTMESFSLNLISRNNPALGGQLTPNLDALPPSESNFRSVSMPTQYGLASHLCSHPFGEGIVELGHPNALPDYLNKQGWLTAFYQSAPLDFQRGEKRFKEMGYQVRFGRDEAKQDSSLQPHIGEWGLRDRYVYEQAIKYLDGHRDRSTFLHVLTADTHGPSGRLDYGSQDYPPTPAWISKYHTAGIYLRSWFRADFDLGRFITQLKEKGLFDNDTAIIITGDHNCPINPLYRTIPRIDSELIERIPWILITPRSMPPRPNGRLTSQIATAPTIAHLAGLPPLQGWWGESLYSNNVLLNQIAWRGRDIFIVTTNQVTERAPPDLAAAAAKIEVK
jgi:phosphoglycerol transferase MdoB-like AlkP superfamily enzyme